MRWTAWLSVALVTIGLPRGSAAQQIEAPLFHPGPPIENNPYTVDVSVATDGSIVFIWEESRPRLARRLESARRLERPFASPSCEP